MTITILTFVWFTQEETYMKKLTLIFCLAVFGLWFNPLYAGCTKEEIMRLLDRGFDKTQIEKICSADNGEESRPKSDSGSQDNASAKLQVAFKDHIIDYKGVFEYDGETAKLRVKLYDQETSRLIKEETRDLELVFSEHGKGFRTRFFIPFDSTTPNPHYHEVTLIFEKNKDGSIALQNCNQDDCYPGEVRILKEDSSSRDSNANQPTLSGAFRLEYTAGTYVHQALLIMTGSSGKMRVQFFDPETERTELVEMNMQFKRTLKGDIIEGSEPTDVKKGKQHPTYAADNFVFKRYPNGELKVFNVDDNQVAVEVDMQPIETKQEFKEALKKFQWKLATIPEFEEPLR